jgi:hypothetical protein
MFSITQHVSAHHTCHVDNAVESSIVQYVHKMTHKHSKILFEIHKMIAVRKLCENSHIDFPQKGRVVCRNTRMLDN